MAIVYRNSFHLYPSMEEGSNMVTVGQLRQFVSLLDKFSIADDYPLEACDLLVEIAVDHTQVDTIVCGDCVPDKNDADATDVILTVHQCDRHAVHSKT